MITKDNFRTVLGKLDFSQNKEIYTKKFDDFDCELKVDFKNELLIYPENKGFTVKERQTCNFKANENFVVFECVHRLLNQGYNPKHIELEPKWHVGHGASGGRADILVKDNEGKSLLIIECKTAGNEFTKAWNTTQTKPTQLFSYVQQAKSTKFIALYASDFIDETVQSNYYLINITDNEELLKNDPTLKSYKNATEVEDIYKVWVDTYEKDFATLGLFENNKPYEIGKTKFSVEDLKNISSKDIQGKYHEFATILRQHNVSGRENAFDKLVNLFLCKVTDEKENPNELKFYWKGKAYDNPFDFQDRLQQLYKNGMEKFLGETITYIDNNQIDEAFNVFKNKPNSTKEQIKNYFRELKFFTNNDFAFIDVHNEKLFYQNFEVLLKIARMIQDISLTSSDENQFLGDMFEGFLDQGVKQSEGQFFTPMPIVKFIINSLPNKENPSVIDYACGAGHFLNEYTTINKTAKITGIEKEYRLSKVAKVSSFMYGSDINIIYDDALSSNEKIKNNAFDVLIANPPYSVKGFLETLKDEDRAKYELINTIDEKSYSANNSIECFFIEKSKQLLKQGGVAGIIVPSSILNKGSQSIGTNKKNVYVATREILLKYFDIVAIAEFGSGTFGKTGTNTVTLFLRRKNTNLDISEHLKNMVDSWFECDFETNKAFNDDGLLERYCSHIEIDFEIYKTLLCSNIDDKLFAHETFKEYKQSYGKLSTALKKKYTMTHYIREIEKDKFYYFCLAHKNSCDVVIVKSPSESKESKKFLGYEWSSAKGNEGIHYLTSSHSVLDTESITNDFDEEDKRILENLQGLKSINTPLYNPQNSEDKNKINKIIKDNFSRHSADLSRHSVLDTESKMLNQVQHDDIPEALKPFVTRARLVDMLDFTRVDFNKAIGLNPNKKIEIIGKPEWQRKLGDVVEVLIGGTPSRANSEYFDGHNLWVSISEMNGQIINDTKEKISDEGVKKSNVKLIPKGTTLLSFKLSIGKTAIAGKDLYTNEAIAGLIPKTKELKDDYLFHLFNGKIIDLEKDSFNTFGKSLNSTFLKNEVKIPLPPLDIQEQIVLECQKVDDDVQKANETIQKSKQEIIDLVKKAQTQNTMKLGEACDMKAGKFVSASDIFDQNDGNLYPCFGGNGQRGYTKTFTHEGIYPLIGRQGALCGNITLAHGKFHATEHAVAVIPKIELDVIWLYYKLIIMNLNQYKTGTAQPGLSVKNINNVNIEIPPLETQKQIVSKIEALESKINEAKKVIDGAKEQKEAILKRHLF
ncbi:MAG: restriction endonuclease subunit S [Sulfurovum sp.]|nr:restriction endonuclease subunit S [Sulfurovum sp.]